MLPDDIYQWKKFYDNEEQRLHLKLNKKLKLTDLKILIRKKTGYPSKDLMLYRVKYKKTKVL